MTKLSVNVNKVATIRNSRGGRLPSVIEAVRVCIDAGAPGITVHPRADAAHITFDDAGDRRGAMPLRGKIEFNIEGDPSRFAAAQPRAPRSRTLVPVLPGEITSRRWPADTLHETPRSRHDPSRLACARLFVDPQPAPIRWARS
jgi:pyridoxine 5-phosphate synthase